MVREIVQIAYAPAAYYRPWKVAYRSATTDQQRWLNTTLLRQRRLPMPASLEPPCDPLARRLIGLWPRVPEVATLMGAARLRDWLPAQRGFAALPLTVQAFVRAGHCGTRSGVLPATAPERLHDALLLWGGAELQPLTLLLPAWLSTRLSLPFAPLTVDGMRPAACERADMDLFWSAVTYVEKLS